MLEDSTRAQARGETVEHSNNAVTKFGSTRAQGARRNFWRTTPLSLSNLIAHARRREEPLQISANPDIRSTHTRAGARREARFRRNLLKQHPHTRGREYKTGPAESAAPASPARARGNTPWCRYLHIGFDHARTRAGQYIVTTLLRSLKQSRPHARGNTDNFFTLG
jgi:hypothetical protein